MTSLENVYHLPHGHMRDTESDWEQVNPLQRNRRSAPTLKVLSSMPSRTAGETNPSLLSIYIDLLLKDSSKGCLMYPKPYFSKSNVNMFYLYEYLSLKVSDSKYASDIKSNYLSINVLTYKIDLHLKIFICMQSTCILYSLLNSYHLG